MSKLNITTENGLPSPLPVIDEDPPIHVGPYYFCTNDPTCLCHDDPDLIAQVAGEVEDGLLTPNEATRIVQGRQLNS